MFWFYKMAGLAGLENSSEETLISDVPGDLLDIVDRDHSMICKQKKKMFKNDPIRDRQPMKLH